MSEGFPLHEAAESGDVKRVEELIAASHDDISGNTLPLTSFREGKSAFSVASTPETKALLTDAFLELGNLRGDTNATERACEEGDADLLAMLLENGKNTGAWGVSLDSCFEKAATQGHTSILSLLVKEGIDPVGNNGWPLVYAAEHGHAETVAFLAEAEGVDVGAMDGLALAKAAENGHADVVRVLAGTEGAYSDGRDPVRAAAKNGHVEALKAVLEIPGAKVSNMAIRMAMRNNQAGALEALLASGLADDDDVADAYEIALDDDLADLVAVFQAAGISPP